MSKIPKFDKRNAEDIMKQIKGLAAQYTPEWNMDENSDDLGVVFSKVYSKMMENTITKYNKMVYNYYLTFLNTLGTKLRPAAPSEGIITLTSAPGSDSTHVEKGTAVYTESEDTGEAIVYETVDALTAVDTRISKIYFTEPESDFIGCVYDANPKDSEQSDEEEAADGVEEEIAEESEGAKKVGNFRIFDNVYYKNHNHHY